MKQNKSFRKLNQLSYKPLKTLADVDRNLTSTREVVIIKDEHGACLYFSTGTNIILANDLMDLVTYSDHSEGFKKNAIFTRQKF